MDFCRFRMPARVVGYADLVVSTASFLFVGLITVDVLQDLKHDGPERGLISLIVFALCIEALKIFAAVKLLHCTDIGKDLTISRNLAVFWRNVSLVYLIFCVSAFFEITQVALIGLIIRAVFLFIVWKLIGEVDQVLLGTSDQV